MGYINTAQLYEIFRQHPKVVTDSRQVQPGCLFFALRGAHFDGNQFAGQALAQGAAFAIVDDVQLAHHTQHLLVPNVLEALQDLARHHRRQFDIPVVGITGSNGKTTTKELIANVLATHYKVHFTHGNLNNHIGVPLTLLAMPADTQIAVIEMGANHQGEIDLLARIAEPTHGLITNIGKAHLEGFGGIEGVKKGKSELYRFLIQRDGTLFINAGEAFLQELAAGANRQILYGKLLPPSPTPNVIPVQLIGEQPFVSVSFFDEDGRTVAVHSQLPGAYNFGNIASAIALGKHFGVPATQIKTAIEAYQPANMRSQVIRQGSNTYILDAYNANPTSTAEALRSFAQMPAEHKIVILGDMLELGEYAAEEHAYIARLAASLGFAQVVLTGPIYGGLPKMDGITQLPEAASVTAWLKEQNLHAAHILLKGSRGMAMERVLELIQSPSH